MKMRKLTYLCVHKETNNNHEYNNALTKDITIESLFGTCDKYVEGNVAISKFNENQHYFQIPKLDLSLYNPYYFQYLQNKNWLKILILEIDNDKLNEHYNNIPNLEFLLFACEMEKKYTYPGGCLKNIERIFANHNNVIASNIIHSNENPT